MFNNGRMLTWSCNDHFKSIKISISQTIFHIYLISYEDDCWHFEWLSIKVPIKGRSKTGRGKVEVQTPLENTNLLNIYGEVIQIGIKPILSIFFLISTQWNINVLYFNHSPVGGIHDDDNGHYKRNTNVNVRVILLLRYINLNEYLCYLS